MRRFLAVIAAALAAFFVFYTVRLVVVTRGLMSVRATGHGAYTGAIVFPILAVAFAWVSWRLWRTKAESIVI